MILTINLEKHHNYILLEFIGKVSKGNVGIISRALDLAISSYKCHILVDLSKLQEINSSGLQVLLKKRMKMSCFLMMILCNPSSKIKSLMELVGITEFIPITSNIFDAETMLKELDFVQGHILPTNNNDLHLR